MTCSYCGTNQPWPTAFPVSHYAKCRDCYASAPRTGGFFDGLTVKAGDSAGKRLAKELGMFALLTSPAWLALLLLPKKGE